MDKKFYDELEAELSQNILPYWEKYAKDTATEGFFGAIDNDNKCDPNEWRGIVMVSRFLWSYSAAARLYKKTKYLDMADYAYQYMFHHFFDTLHGGMCWAVKADGDVLDSRKQIYGDAFSIYAISEYAAALHEVRKLDYPAQVVMDKALALYTMMEKFAKDPVAGGYCEALNEDWTPTKDTKLSPKDIDCDKSMNTNLHVMEAYTNLYRNLPVVYPDQKDTRKLIGKSLTDLVRIHVTKILAKDNHLRLYFNKDWTQTGRDEISYGHDIEASWLLWEAANELQDESLMAEVRPISINIARTALVEGFDKTTGGFENTMLDGKRDTTRIWWNQAESLNGFYNAWELTGGEDFKNAFLKEWEWIKKSQRDSKNGDWFWAVDKEGNPDLHEVKGGNWKTSYHNSRCCMELLKRSGYFA
jgi:mannobiose 2-epimerase